MPKWTGTAAQARELEAMGLGGPLAHVVIGSSLSLLERAFDLRRAGMVVVEDGPDGPVMTRTWRGTETLKLLEKEEAE